MADFTINSISYKSKLFDGQKQIHVMKRLLPAFTALAGVASQLAEKSAAEVDEVAAQANTADQIALKLAPVSEALAKLSDLDTDFILNACLDVTERTVAIGTGWAPVRQSGHIQDPADAKFATRLMIAWYVIGENFSDMFSSFGVDLKGLMGKTGAGV